jgi:hypothetical protein
MMISTISPRYGVNLARRILVKTVYEVDDNATCIYTGQEISLEMFVTMYERVLPGCYKYTVSILFLSTVFGYVKHG